MRDFIKGMLAAAALTALSGAPALAGTIALTNGGGWVPFQFGAFGTYFQDYSGDPVDFTFTLAKTTTLLVADGGFAGDEFDITINGKDAGDTSASIFDGQSVEYGPPTDDHECFSCAVYDPVYNTAFSHGAFVLGAGVYDVTGNVLIGGASGFSDSFGVGTAGIALGAVPEPATWTMMLAGFFGLGAAVRASRRRKLGAATV